MLFNLINPHTESKIIDFFDSKKKYERATLICIGIVAICVIILDVFVWRS